MKLYHVDAFTNTPFKGNPAAVCIVDDKLEDNVMQNIADEMNLSETAFVQRKGNNEFGLRWFTPQVEVDLCGHATLASSHILYETKMISSEEDILFHTKSGKLLIKKDKSKIIMDFPQISVSRSKCPEKIKRAFNIEPLDTHSNDKRYLIEIEDAQKLCNMTPDFSVLEKYNYGFIITAKSRESEYDFISRFFAPCVGINEDPVTGSAHSYLAPYWGRKLNKDMLIGYQASKRTGIVECELIDNDRVLLKGVAITIFETELKNIY